MSTKIHPFQVMSPQGPINGYVERNHLYTRLADQPEVFMPVLERFMQVNFQANFISMVKSHPVEYIEAGADGEFTWNIDYTVDQHNECLGAWADAEGTVAIVDGDKSGAGRTSFFLDFRGNPFQTTELILGMNPSRDRLLVKNVFEGYDGVQRVQVELAHSKGPSDYIAFSAIAEGTLWSSGGGLVAKYLADTGIDISFRTPVKARGEMSSFRVKHVVAGHNVDWKPKSFYMPGKNGGQGTEMWMSTVEYEFLKRIAWTESMLIQEGRSNRWADGSHGNYDKNGHEIIAGSGWKEQVAASNRHTFVGAPNIREIVDIIMAVVVGRTDARTAVIRAGEFGLMALHDAVIKEYQDSWQSVPYMQDNTGRAFEWQGNNVNMKFAQIKGMATLGGITLLFELDPSKDDPSIHKIKMNGLRGGFAASYQYDIIGIGGKDSKSNMKIVRRANQSPTFGIVDGMRSIKKVISSYSSPKSLATPIDGFEMHYQDFGVGAKVVDPTAVIQYYPSQLPY